MNGINYVPVPDYNADPVRARTVPDNLIIPSSATQIDGTYFAWNDDGFIGKGWLLSNYDGPHPFRDNTSGIKLTNDDEVRAWFENGNTNLNQFFKNWEPNFEDSMRFSDQFRNGGPNEGCAFQQIGGQKRYNDSYI